MRHLVTLGLLVGALGACRNEPPERGADAGRPGAGPEAFPGVTATAPPAGGTDAGAAAADAGIHAVPADGGLAQPPSTAMPGGRPTYPDAGTRRR